MKVKITYLDKRVKSGKLLLKEIFTDQNNDVYLILAYHNVVMLSLNICMGYFRIKSLKSVKNICFMDDS